MSVFNIKTYEADVSFQHFRTIQPHVFAKLKIPLIVRSALLYTPIFPCSALCNVQIKAHFLDEFERGQKFNVLHAALQC